MIDIIDVLLLWKATAAGRATPTELLLIDETNGRPLI